MRGDIGPIAATWHRADRYEVVNGTHIRPALGARFEEFPLMGHYEQFWERASGEPPLYVSLQDLDLDDDGAVLDWCARFGLLGILHHRLVDVGFWPTWERHFFRGLSELKPHQIVLREADTFTQFQAHDVPADLARSLPRRDEDEGRRLTGEELRTTLGAAVSPFRAPGATIRALESSAHLSVGVVEAYGQFFPHIAGIPTWVERESRTWNPFRPRPAADSSSTRDAATVQYPLPSDPAFPELYAEPLYLFHRVVRGLRVELDPSTARAKSLPREARLSLRQVRPSARSVEGRWRQVWEVSSLIAGCSLMILKDMTLGAARMPDCQHCGKRVVTMRWNRVYCSKQCRNAADRKRQRAKFTTERKAMLHRLEENRT